jgi:hypothetical protein
VKRTIQAGPKACIELGNLLGGFEIDLAKGDRTEGRIIGDLFRMFQMTPAQIKQVNFHEPTKDERKERNLGDNVTHVWTPGMEDIWTYRLSETESTVLEKVIRTRKGTYNFLRDAWEDVILTQLAGPLSEDPVAEAPKEPLALVARASGRGRNKAAYR